MSKEESCAPLAHGLGLFDASGAVCRWAAVAGMLSERLEMMLVSYQW